MDCDFGGFGALTPDVYPFFSGLFYAYALEVIVFDGGVFVSVVGCEAVYS